MTPDSILSHAPNVLTQPVRERYFQQGYLFLEGRVDALGVGETRGEDHGDDSTTSVARGSGALPY